jgi:hypothetical protein
VKVNGSGKWKKNFVRKFMMKSPKSVLYSKKILSGFKKYEKYWRISAHILM